jgi:hypothetical protein
LLDGINPEVVEMLKDRVAGTVTFDVLRSMGLVRQLEAAELMQSVSNFTLGYARALLAATKQADLAKPEQCKRIDA